MPSYKLTETEKITHWKEIILANLKSINSQEMAPQEFLALYPHAEITILQTAITELITEGKVEQV